MAPGKPSYRCGFSAFEDWYHVEIGATRFANLPQNFGGLSAEEIWEDSFSADLTIHGFRNHENSLIVC